MFRRQGLAEKYEHAGVYCIKIDEQIVYIGKSLNMMERIAAHYVGIKRGSELKYRILQELQRKGKTVKFDVLYNAESEKYYNAVNEIGEKEGELIREHLPLLNTQIPKKENWHKWDIKPLDAKKVLSQLLENDETRSR